MSKQTDTVQEGRSRLRLLLGRRRQRDDLFERSFRECPSCSEEVYVLAFDCRHCGEELELLAG